MKSSERTKFKKRIMSFDMTGYTSWKSNTTTDVVTWSWKDELDKKQDSDHHEEDDENVCHEESLRREKDLKRPMVDVERRIIRGSSSGLKRERSLSDDQEDEEKLCVPKKRNFIKFKRTKSESEQIPHAELPENVKNRINQLGKRVKEVKLIIQKEIYKTDASESHNRLSIPAAQITDKFLRDKEEEHLCMRNGKKVNPLEVRVIDPSLKISVLELRRWEMKKVRKEVMKSLNSKQKQKEESKTSVSYVLNGKWTEMRIANGIEEGHRIQIWAVRMDDDDELIIVLVKLPDEVTTEEEDVRIEEQEAEDCADSKFDKTNVASTSKQCGDLVLGVRTDNNIH
ncbi:uncharacterized protein LOC132642652 [Lycium barbarum]|uniref:uncharacterized protein LOC132642652 n=1 Tax=Lycium barbarum TaxID=112863 RepID=UPI00293EBA07|nr:uncharacterized protein LOC132642652 [Lycium barbarum]